MRSHSGLFLAVLLSLFTVALALHASPPAGVVGKWSGAVDLAADGRTNRIVLTCDFKVDGQSVTGSLGPAPDTQFKIQSGTFDGKTLVVKAPMPTRLYTMTLTVTDKNRMTGAVAAADGKASGSIALAREAAEAYTAVDLPELRGPYLGQSPPGSRPERFAPGIVSVAATLDSVPQFTPDGQEAYWSRVGPGGGIVGSRVENGRWTVPRPTPLMSAGALDLVPVLFAAGQKLLIHSTRGLPDGRTPERGFFSFWVTRREGGAWATLPTPLDFFYTGKDDFSTIGEDATLYLGPQRGIGAIKRAAFVDGRYAAPAPLSPPVDGFPCLVGPRDEYLVVARGEKNRDLFILFRKPDGSYTLPVNLGPRVNSSATEQFASLSHDGRYFFFSSDRTGNFEVYWIDASFIDGLRKEATALDSRSGGWRRPLN